MMGAPLICVLRQNTVFMVVSDHVWLEILIQLGVLILQMTQFRKIHA